MADKKYSATQIYDYLFYQVISAREKFSDEDIALGYCRGVLFCADKENFSKDLAIELVLKTFGALSYRDGKLAEQELNVYRKLLELSSSYTSADFFNDYYRYNNNATRQSCFATFKKFKQNATRTAYIQFCIALAVCDRNYSDGEIEFCRRLCRLFDVHE